MSLARCSDPRVTLISPANAKPAVLDLAHRQYPGERLPPFYFPKTSDVRRTVVIPSMASRRPVEPTYAFLVAKPWGERHQYWTLDKNGCRHIVAYHGESGVYYSWIGHGKGKAYFKEPVALPDTIDRNDQEVL